ncbi:MAG: hypothetical protein LBU28_09930 [Spirochaetaceae bacterium]|nr:hypothetical protein [Spirochaetaceae bacterium]
MKTRLFLLMVPLALLCGSCSARINGALRRDGTGGLTLQAALEPRMTALIRALAALNPDAGSLPAEAPLIDGAAISRSLSAAPGVAAAALVNTGPAAIAGPVTVSRVDELLALSGTQGTRFIAYEQGPDGGLLTITIDRASGPSLLALISPDVKDYLSALLAPVSTGEALSRAEYLGLVAGIYGRAIAEEIAAARIHLSIEFPGPVRSARGGSFTGSRAQFEVPLTDLLVLESPLVYEVRWR